MRVTSELPDTGLSSGIARMRPRLTVRNRDREWLKEKGRSSSTGTVPTSTVAYLFWLVVQATDCSSTFWCSLSPVGAELL